MLSRLQYQPEHHHRESLLELDLTRAVTSTNLVNTKPCLPHHDLLILRNSKTYWGIKLLRKHHLYLQCCKSPMPLCCLVAVFSRHLSLIATPM